MKRYLITVLLLFTTAIALAAPKKEKVEEQHWFNFKNTTLAGAQIGFGPSFGLEGGARDFTVEVYNVTVCLNTSKNGRYVIEGDDWCVNPRVTSYSFGYDVPLYNKGRFFCSVNPMLGWEIKYYYANYTYTKMVDVHRERSGPVFGIGMNFDVETKGKMCVRAGTKYINETLTFSFGMCAKR